MRFKNDHGWQRPKQRCVAPRTQAPTSSRRSSLIERSATQEKTKDKEAMKMKMFSVYDSKAEAYLAPFFSATEATAMRAFEAAAKDEQHDFHKWSEDYTLFCLGTFDEFTGIIEPLAAPYNLGSAHIIKSINGKSAIQGS